MNDMAEIAVDVILPTDENTPTKKGAFQWIWRFTDSYNFHLRSQFEANSQLLNLRAYANSKNVRLCGDVPFYVSHER